MADLNNVEGIALDMLETPRIFYMKGPEVLGDSAPSPVVLENMNPAAGSNVLASQPVTFDLRVAGGATLDYLKGARVIIWVMYPDLGGSTEVAHDGENFTASFDGSGTTLDILSGGTFIARRFTVLRNGGWPSRPQIFIHANTDLGGLN